MIDVNHCKIEDQFFDYKNNEYYFSISHTKKDLYKVKSEEGCNKWVDLINSTTIYAKFWNHVASKHPKAIDYLIKQKIESVSICYQTGKMTKRLFHSQDKIIEKQTQESKGKSSSSSEVKLIDDSSLTGITFHSFELIDLIGSGAFGKVFKVNLKDTNKIFAMKILNKKSLILKKQIHYAISECNVLKQTNSPFIVTLHYSFQTPTNLYMILDYCPGGDLAIHIQKRKFDEEESKFYIAELVLGIEHLHIYDIIYRDLKPENILIDSDGHIKLADFGLAKENIKDNIKAKSFCGSPAYLSPEMISRKGVGKSADIYGIGAVLYEMINGFPPFYANDIHALYNNIIRSDLCLHNNLSYELQDLLRKLMNRDPNKRIGIQDIKAHPFFYSIDWDKLEIKKIDPPLDLVSRNSQKKKKNQSNNVFKDNDYYENNKNYKRLIDFTFVRPEEEETNVFNIQN